MVFSADFKIEKDRFSLTLPRRFHMLLFLQILCTHIPDSNSLPLYLPIFTFTRKSILYWDKICLASPCFFMSNVENSSLRFNIVIIKTLPILKKLDYFLFYIFLFILTKIFNILCQTARLDRAVRRPIDHAFRLSKDIVCG